MRANLNEITPDQLLNYFNMVRAKTLEILAPLEIEDYVVQTDFFMSPPRWHLGHVSWFFDQLLRQHHPGFKPFERDFDHYLNSYYRNFGEPFDKGRRGTVSRPTVTETRQYAAWIDEQVKIFISGHSESLSEELYRLFILGFHHEYQHQELLIYDLQHLLQERYNPKERKSFPDLKKNLHTVGSMQRIPGGIFQLGFDRKNWGDFFCYDIELPLHKVYFDDFWIDTYPVSNEEYLQFIEDGGYKNFCYWLSDGWDYLQKESWQAPMYWEKGDNGEWFKRDFRGNKYIRDILAEPVIHVSYFEAAAYARWAGKRLPTEAEWEKAASWDDDRNEKRIYPWGNEKLNEGDSNLFESSLWSVTPLGSFPRGRSFFGCEQMVGDCWEWTSSEFTPYPRFVSGFAEYNDKWFDNQKVLRGGSFATPRDQTRTTYRNFFRCHERWMFAGFRCAKDV